MDVADHAQAGAASEDTEFVVHGPGVEGTDRKGDLTTHTRAADHDHLFEGEGGAPGLANAGVHPNAGTGRSSRSEPADPSADEQYLEPAEPALTDVAFETVQPQPNPGVFQPASHADRACRAVAVKINLPHPDVDLDARRSDFR
ncbi:hypothetical protein [Streptomyces sp. AGS-58]|uniref:hypothetical protein n=1 Tax=unclassified Streptomyces TaxID=2593676 RepID=UPI0035A30231